VSADAATTAARYGGPRGGRRDRLSAVPPAGDRHQGGTRGRAQAEGRQWNDLGRPEFGLRLHDVHDDHEREHGDDDPP
jgi:hypothetical protein